MSNNIADAYYGSTGYAPHLVYMETDKNRRILAQAMS